LEKFGIQNQETHFLSLNLLVAHKLQAMNNYDVFEVIPLVVIDWSSFIDDYQYAQGC
jgi:hypothetical protein